MARVKIKHPDPNPNSKLKLLRTLSENLIYATKLIPVYDGFILLTRNDEEVDKVFKSNCLKLLKDQGFEPILPPELRAKRTVILLNVDDLITTRTEKEIEEELLKENEWIEGIDNIFKIPKSRHIKVGFKETNTAKTATEKGLLAFHMSIPSYNIKIDEFIPILTCMRCYSLEEHTTSKCPKPKDNKICSECGSSSHTWRECKETNKKCINCEGQHRTLANKCPKRKEIVESKRKGKKNNNTTYSQITKGNNNNTNITSKATDLFDNDTASTILTCILHAHLGNIAHPGTYNEEVNKLFKLNKLPPIVLPDNPPSKLILSLATKNDMEEDTEEAETNQGNNNEEKDEAMSEKDEEEELNQTQAEKPSPSEKIRGRGIGLQIVTKKSTGWPKEQIYIEQIKEGIDSGKYKWIFTSTAYREEEIYTLLINNGIELNKVWTIVDDSIFRKIRNGLQQEKTPPHCKDNKHTKIRHNSN